MVLSLPLGELTRGLSDHQLPQLAWLNGRARQAQTREKPVSDYACLYQYAGYRGPPPVAALTGLADQLPTENDFWLRADPVHLQVDMGPVYLTLEPRRDEMNQQWQSLASSLRAHLAGSGWSLHTPDSSRWYLQSDTGLSAWLPPPDQSLGIHLAELLPMNAAYRATRQLQNEIQMLMHEADSTALPGQPNSLWLWGGGRLPEPAEDTGWVLFNPGEVSPFSEGLARHARARTVAAKDVQWGADDSRLCHWRHDPEKDQATNATELENLLKPALDALRDRQLQELVVDDGSTVRTVVTGDVWRFWRRPALPGE